MTVPITLTANSKGVQLSMQGAKIRLTPKEIQLLLPPAGVTLGPTGLNAKHGGADLNLQQLKVSINKGAFEVT